MAGIDFGQFEVAFRQSILSIKEAQQYLAVIPAK